MDRGVYTPRERLLTRIRYTTLCVITVGVLAMTPFRPLKITGHSMEPTLRDGETYLLDHFYWRSGGVHRGDLVVVRHSEENWVKRLAGMAGDRLQIVYRPSGAIAEVVNVSQHPEQRVDSPWAREQQVRPGEIFVVGDNINHSTDSTTPWAGSFKEDDIIGVVRTFTMGRRFPFRKHL